MDAQTRKALTQALQKHVAEIAKDLREKLLMPGVANARARTLHAEEKVADAFELWTDLLSRRAAVLWVLKTVYVRVLEDRGLLLPRRLSDSTSWQLFSHLAPNLGHSAYLRWVFKDLASDPGGLPELFSPQAAEVAEPGDAVSKALIDFWQAKDEATGQSRWRFDDEHFDGRLMGDLYQDLDPVVRERFALLQTPDFVLEFILERTLTPAIEAFGVETVRVLDPACGSGHFLIAALKRLVAGMEAKFPERPKPDVVQDCLSRIVGIDLNDYACGLARSRLVMTALELTGERDLSAASGFHPKVFWADGLDQLEKDEPEQGELFVQEEKPTAVLTRPEVRVRLRPELERKFHAIVANPPYIRERDPSRKDYHREKLGKTQRYVSAYREYSLGCPFAERMFQLALEGAYVGQITANSFMKREFGAALIEKVLPHEDLFLVIDTSGAYIPGHGTPTILLFGRRQSPTQEGVRVVMGKRGEPGVPADSSKGKVWTSIAEGWSRPGYENEFVSVGDVERTTLNEHPWSIGGGGAAELKEALEAAAEMRLGGAEVASSIGFMCITKADEVFSLPSAACERNRIPSDWVRASIDGEHVRDWRVGTDLKLLFPYSDQGELKPIDECVGRQIWRHRTTLQARAVFGGKTFRQVGRPYWAYGQIPPDRIAGPAIAFAEVATHNHFVLDRGGKVFKQTAPIIKLPRAAGEAEHLALLGLLNSSAALFWLRQVCQCKGAGGVNEGLRFEKWAEFFQFSAGKLEHFPLPKRRDAPLEAYAAAADRIARERAGASAISVITANAKLGAKALEGALAKRREEDSHKLRLLVAIQEELDWYVYSLYGLCSDTGVRPPEALSPLTPGQRPFELTLAIDNEQRVAAVARGEEPDEAPTEWFSRHGWDPVTSLDAVPADQRAVIERRLELTKDSRFLSLIEQPSYKHRWYRPDYAAEEKTALETFLCDRMEDFAQQRDGVFTLKQMVASLQSNPEVLAVVELLADDTLDFEAILTAQLTAQSVPNVKHHVFKPSGLEKRAVWENTWALQHREDKGEKVTPPVPPKYASKDYLRGEYWSHRGALDVANERFIAFTEVPQNELQEPVFGWAGWTPLQRAQQLVELETEAQNAGVPKDERVALLHGIQFLLPYVAWESKDAADEFRSIVQAFTGSQGVTEEMLDRWAEAHPPSVARKKKARNGRAA